MRVIAQLRFIVGLLVLLAIQTLTLTLAIRLRLLSWGTRGARCGTGTRREDGVFDKWLRDAVCVIVRRSVVLILRIWLVIPHGRRIALPTLLRTPRGRCRSSLLLLLLRLRLLRLLLLLLLEPR